MVYKNTKFLILKGLNDKNYFDMLDFYYKNPTSALVVLKCLNENNFFLERVIFPGETFLATVPSDSKVEIWGIHSYGPTLEQRFRLSEPQKYDSIAS
tara:strand:+ start:716 stop:1006 length:291 start_codon:yes stop_codon:yes gene_type:complete